MEARTTSAGLSMCPRPAPVLTKYGLLAERGVLGGHGVQGLGREYNPRGLEIQVSDEEVGWLHQLERNMQVTNLAKTITECNTVVLAKREPQHGNPIVGRFLGFMLGLSTFGNTQSSEATVASLAGSASSPWKLKLKADRV